MTNTILNRVLNELKKKYILNSIEYINENNVIEVEPRKHNQSTEIESVAWSIQQNCVQVALLGREKCSSIFFTLVSMMVKKIEHTHVDIL